MKTSLSSTLNFTLQHEGGYSAQRSDPGNWTGGRVGSGTLAGSKFGLSAPLVARDRGIFVGSQQIKLLSEDDFRSLAVKYFWEPLGCNLLPPGIDALVFDHAFNAGGKTSIKLLQQIVGVDPDGVVGSATLQAITAVRIADIGRFVSSTLLLSLQKWMGIPETGRLDELTINTVERRGRRLELICSALVSLQMADYRSKKEFQVFGDGWMRRARERFQLAIELVVNNRSQA